MWLFFLNIKPKKQKNGKYSSNYLKIDIVTFSEKVEIVHQINM